MYASRTGAHRSLKQSKISCRWFRAECSGDGVGDNGDERVSNIAWFSGTMGVKATWRSS